MEKSAAARNEKVSNDIPNDLTFFILSRLPHKSLKRFSCVCKSWALFFETSYFMSMFRNNFLFNNHSVNDDKSILLLQTNKHIFARPTNFSNPDNLYDNVLYSLSGENYENKEKLEWPNPFQEDNHVFDIVGSSGIGGVLCLVSCSQSRFVLWNPATKELRVIPHSPHQLVLDTETVVEQHGFGYVRDDYKLIQCVTYSLDNEIWDVFWEIYSLQSNSWRTVDAAFPYYEDQGVYMDGMYHWWREDDETDEVSLLSFDFSNEVFITTPLPPDEDDLNSGFVWRHLEVLSGQIALISSYKTATFHISILGEVGVEESWTTLFTVGPLPCIDVTVGAGKKSDVLFRKKDGKLASIDFSTQHIEDIGIEVKKYCCKVASYKKSLLPIGEINIP